MEAAYSLTVSKGMDKVTIVDIVEEAKTSRVTFYKYFDTVFDIFWEIHKYILAEMIVFFKENISGRTATQKIHYVLDLCKPLFIERINDIKFTVFFDCYHNHLANEDNYLDFIIYSDFYDSLINEGIEDASIKDAEKFRKKLVIQINAIWALMQRLSIRKDHIQIETSYNALSILEGLIASAHIILKDDL